MSYIYKQGLYPQLFYSVFTEVVKNLTVKNELILAMVNNFVVSNDSYTKEITMKTYKHMLSKGIQPYL